MSEHVCEWVVGQTTDGRIIGYCKRTDGYMCTDTLSLEQIEARLSAVADIINETAALKQQTELEATTLGLQQDENAELKRILASEEMIETLADIEHERWSRWMRYQFDNWTDENIERWKMLIETSYAELSEHSKESDRKEVRKTLAAIDALLTKEK